MDSAHGNGRMRVVFLPNFIVSLGQKVYPAVRPFSEQISTAGKEARHRNLKIGP